MLILGIKGGKQAKNKSQHSNLWGGKLMEKEILTIEEAAEYLRMGKRSIYKLAKSGSIPCKKILNKYRFDKESLRDWVLGKN